MNTVSILESLDIINDSVNAYEGERPFLSTGNLNVSAIDDLEYYTFQDKPSRANLNVKSGDLILARMKDTLKVKMISDDEENIIVSTGFLVLRPKKNLDNNYLFHVLKSSTFQNDKNKLCTGATQKAINNANFAKIKIPLPDLATQKRIADILDKAAEIRDYNLQLIAKYEELKQSIFLDMFGDPVKNEKGWVMIKLGDVANVRTGPFGSLLHVEDYVEDGTPLVNPTHIVNGSIKEDFKLSVNEEKLSKLSGYQLQTNDIVLGRRGEMGRCAVVTERESGFLCGTGSLIIRPNENLNAFFLFKLLSSNKYKTILETKANGVTMKNLNSKIIENLIIPFPKIEVQEKFESSLEVISKQISAANKTYNLSENLFNSLTQKAFSDKS